MMKYQIALAALIVVAPLAASAQGKPGASHGKGMKHERAASVMAPDAIVWGPAPASLPAGAKAAVLDGNPMVGGQFTLRLMLPDGYMVPPHSHPTDELVTVIKGNIMVGMGAKFDESQMQKNGSGTFAMIPAGMKHFVKADGETIVQINGKGPFRITYANKADDPRKTNK